MVYTASGQPLYVPPHARKHHHHAMDQAENDMQDNGMQSLLSAIELDMSNRSLTPHISEHSFVDSPDHQELMADLLGTNFTTEDSTHAGSKLEQGLPYQIPSAPSLGGQESVPIAHAIDVDPQSNRQTYDAPPGPPIQEYTRRVWRGLEEKWVDRDTRNARVKDIIAENLVHLDGQRTDLPIPLSSRLVKIRFAWPAVAQKSYGSEKRLLTPAPICKIAGYHEALCGSEAVAHLLIMPDNSSNVRFPQQSLKFDHSLRANFKNLHINNDNLGKSKAVRLKLQIAQKNFTDPSDVPLAEFNSSDIVLLSKPSKRAGRLKMQNSFIYAGESISLYNRINSQTVRTKYLHVEHGEMSAQADSWTAFRIHPYMTDSNQLDMTDRPLQYDMTVVLSDPVGGFMSPPMIIRRLEGKMLAHGSIANISQMQKIAFERFVGQINDPIDLHRSFLSARQAQATKESVEPVSPFTSFDICQPSDSAAESANPIIMEDCVQWTVAGVGSTEITFLDTLSDPPSYDPASPADVSSNTLPPVISNKRKFSQADGPGHSTASSRSSTTASQAVALSSSTPSAAVPPDASGTEALAEPQPEETAFSASAHFTNMRLQLPLTPFPTLLGDPILLPQANRLHLQIRDFWQPSSAFAAVPDIWLGTVGPLTLQALQQSVLYLTDAAIEVELPAGWNAPGPLSSTPQQESRGDAADVREDRDKDIEDGKRPAPDAPDLSPREEGRESLPILFVREDGIVSLAGTLERTFILPAAVERAP